MRFASFRHVWSSLGFFVLAVVVAGCPTPTETSPAPSQTCVTRYAQCRMPDGPLGVCNDVPCEEGQAEPCLKCVSQH